jgi:FKBP-type peptidyl-prolyl cis-trans isomerase FkpA
MDRVFALVILLLIAACSREESAPAQQPGEAVPTPAAAAPSAPAKIEITHLVEGTGAQPSASDVVVVHYHGTFADGSVFDSSVQRGEPARFPLNRVIPCWTQGVQQIKVGGKAKLVCPPETAYGAGGMPPRIPPNATLTFEVELLGIE